MGLTSRLCRKFCSRLMRTFGSLVILLTFAVLLAIGKGLTDRCVAYEPSEEWSRRSQLSSTDARLIMLWVHAMYVCRLVVSAPAAILMSWRSSTSHMWRLATYIDLSWTYDVLRATIFVRGCFGEESSFVLNLISDLLWLYTQIMSVRLFMGNVIALQTSAMQRIGAGTQLRCIFRLGIVIGILYVGALAMGMPVLLNIICWLGLLWYPVFVIKTALTMHAARRCALEVAADTLGRKQDEATMSAQLIKQQMYGLISCLSSTWISMFFEALMFGNVWPLPQPPKSASLFICLEILYALENSLNIFGALSLSGAFSGALHGGKLKLAAKRQRRQMWTWSLREWKAHEDIRWHEKMHEISRRGFTLDALLEFYEGLGKAYMQHFDGMRSTTTDVVRGAIIPLSREQRCAHAEVMMRGMCVRPAVMVTHNWANLFRDLVACILADALDSPEYDMIAYMLDSDFETLKTWVRVALVGSRSYWVCAFCVNQHAGICAGNPYKSKDAVLGVEHAVCDCGLDKAWNDTEPLDTCNGCSIPCEMNKFDDMVAFLSATNKDFAQVIAVDAECVLFSRAWCVAEIATAHRMGMVQSLKLKSLSLLEEREEQLKQLRIENMEATRPEDKHDILRKILDHGKFNNHLQKILFKDLLPAWKHMDVAAQLSRVGHVLRYYGMAQIMTTHRMDVQMSIEKRNSDREQRDKTQTQTIGVPSCTIYVL